MYAAATWAKNNLFIIKPNLEHGGRGYYHDSYWGLSKPSRLLSKNGAIEKFADQWPPQDEKQMTWKPSMWIFLIDANLV